MNTKTDMIRLWRGKRQRVFLPKKTWCFQSYAKVQEEAFPLPYRLWGRNASGNVSFTALCNTSKETRKYQQGRNTEQQINVTRLWTRRRPRVFLPMKAYCFEKDFKKEQVLFLTDTEEYSPLASLNLPPCAMQVTTPENISKGDTMNNK
mgnify:CR=1 FL=1